MRPSFRRVKDFTMLPMHALLKATLPFPACWNFCLHTMALAGKGYYRLPGNHIRKALRNFCQSTGREDPDEIFAQLIENMLCACRHYSTLMRDGAEKLVPASELDPDCAARLAAARERYGGAILVLPHCVGAILPAIRLARAMPTVLLVREPVSEARSRMTMEYYARLGTELLAVRRLDPVVVARRLFRALKQKKLVIGTTDRAGGPGSDRVEIKMFGQPVWLADWPARFSAQLQAPILPAYVRMQGERAVLMCDEPYVATDIAGGTQRWATYFESCFRAYPADWLLLYDKRWAAVLRAAAAAPG